MLQRLSRRLGHLPAQLEAMPQPASSGGDEAELIVPNGEHIDLYRPFARGGDLCATFAAVKSPSELLRFVNLHGPLTTRFRSPSPGDKPRSIEVAAKIRKALGGGGESVRSHLHTAEIFRELIRLQAQDNPEKVASYFETNGPIPSSSNSLISRVELVGDSSRGLRFRLQPPHLLGALWYQLGLKLIKGTLRTCPVCEKMFEVGAGTGRRADTTFCCHGHKVEFFNRKRPRATQNAKPKRR